MYVYVELKKKVCTPVKWLIHLELFLVSAAWSDKEYYYSSSSSLLAHFKVSPPPPKHTNHQATASPSCELNSNWNILGIRKILPLK